MFFIGYFAFILPEDRATLGSDPSAGRVTEVWGRAFGCGPLHVDTRIDPFQTRCCVNISGVTSGEGDFMSESARLRPLIFIDFILRSSMR